MSGIPMPPGPWRRELARSARSLSSVDRFWQGLYGKAVISPFGALPTTTPREAAAPSSPPSRSMYDRVGSRVTDT